MHCVWQTEFFERDGDLYAVGGLRCVEVDVGGGCHGELGIGELGCEVREAGCHVFCSWTWAGSARREEVFIC